MMSILVSARDTARLSKEVGKRERGGGGGGGGDLGGGPGPDLGQGRLVPKAPTEKQKGSPPIGASPHPPPPPPGAGVEKLSCS